jgi:hypothetical protein
MLVEDNFISGRIFVAISVGMSYHNNRMFQKGKKEQ